jgi:S1-C subfamily serine protease
MAFSVRLLGLLLAACAELAATPVLAAASLPRDIRLPLDLSVAVYLPAQVRRFHGMAGAFQSGRTVEDTVLSTTQEYFTHSAMAERGSAEAFGLLLSLHPQPLKVEGGALIYSMDYAAFGAGDEPLAKGTESVTMDPRDISGGGPLDNATEKALQQVLARVVTSLRPDATKYPASLSLKTRSLEFAARKDKPWATGTGFYFNASGQVLTAAHVIRDCTSIEVQRDDKTFPGTLLASSQVVDLAALGTGAPAQHFLPFRRSLAFELGEPVTNVGFPLQDLLSNSPNVTRGNVSARGGLKGSEGQIQFSAPIQPGSSGGPVVSDGGELVGVAVGTLNAAAMAKQGIIPQNVNFALDARHAVHFLEKNHLDFTRVDENTHGDLHTANQAALSAVVNVRCYE